MTEDRLQTATVWMLNCALRARPKGIAWPRCETRTSTKWAWFHPKLSNFACPPVYADDYADQLDSIDRNGCVGVPQGPGLGVVYDWAGVEQFLEGERVID